LGRTNLCVGRLRLHREIRNSRHYSERTVGEEGGRRSKTRR
jgi:hypothetical protein